MSDDLTKAIYDSSNLSPKSKQNYKDYFSALKTRAEEDIENVATKPEKYISLFTKWYPKDTTRKSIISAILGLFRYNPSFQEKHKDAHGKWTEAFRETKEKVEKRYDENKPTERQEKGYVPYEDIIKARDALDPGDIRRVLLGMYTYLRPMRCEYSRVAIYKTRPPKDSEPNYIVFKGRKANLVLTHFKTRKFHDPYDIEIPAELVKDIKLSLEKTPRDWLFVNSRDEPYTSHLYTKWTMRVFHALFKRPLTVALIRHAFVNTIDFNTLSIKEKREIATSMGHTVETQDRYRLLFDDAKSKCDCVCTPKDKK